MTRSRVSNEFLYLQRKQLDARFDQLAAVRALQTPKSGWIRAIRTALGMTSAQLGKRLNMTSQGVLDLERREVDESASLRTLREAAEALGCTLVVAMLPRESLESTVRNRAREKAAEGRSRIVHTMRLEDQEAGVDAVLDLDKAQQQLLAGRLADLWD